MGSSKVCPSCMPLAGVTRWDSPGISGLNMQSGGTVPPPPPFGSFPYLFPTTPQMQSFTQQQRFKIKRQRQRVDAGEPRNSYQGSKPGGLSDPLASLFPCWMNGQIEGEIKEDQPTDLSLTTECKDEDETQQLEDELDHLDVENREDPDQEKNLDILKEEEEARPAMDSPASNESSSTCASSSSKRKQTQPQKNIGDIVNEASGETVEEADDLATEEQNPLEKLTALQSQLASPNMQEMMEAQRRLYSNLFEQQKKIMQQNEEKPRLRDFSLLTQSLKTEISENVSSIIDRILKDWAADVARLTAEAQQRPPPMQPMFPGFTQPNPLSFGLPPGPPAGIFPSFNGFNPLAALTTLRRDRAMDDEVKRKRAKVTDNVRKMGTPLGRDSPSSARSSPQLNLSTPLASYFPPTMVGHPLYGGAFLDREDSPTNSDDNSDCGPFDASQSSTLTPMHLKKAKLMFFYTRYPNSTLLKTFFPDIRFNKNNTAQLVKWFSNFREFYYGQIEKFAKTSIAEGMTHRDQLTVTKDSEILKQLNQHYNRNNHIEPPERLAYVVQETIREFFDAIQQGKDSEGSWKKPIYKVIARFDDPIPEYFKDPNFLDRLEQQ